MDSQKIISIIRKEKLNPATSRNFPLLSASILVEGYTRILEEYFGFSYEVIGGLGKTNFIQFFLNEEEIIIKITRMLDSADFKVQSLLDNTKNQFLEFKKELSLEEKSLLREPLRCFKFILEYYPKYFALIGLYNSLQRYLGNNRLKGKLTEQLVNALGVEREEIAKIYPKIEELLQKSSELIGKKSGFDGNLLCYLTLNEARNYLTNKTIDLKKLEFRRGGYFYLYLRGKEEISTDEKIALEIEALFFKDISAKTITGITAYPGKIQGEVINFAQDKPIIKKDFVMVKNMTHPDDIALIDKCSAIITDEGGILSHAAIIAREMKKPCIIGTKIATKVLKTGDWVEVNAEKGTVTKISD